MGIISEFVMASEIDKAIKKNKPKRLKKLLKAQQRIHEQRLREEKRFAMRMQRWFGWSIPEELKAIDLD